MDIADKTKLQVDYYFANKPKLLDMVIVDYHKQPANLIVHNFEPVQSGVIISEPECEADIIREWLCGLIKEKFGCWPGEDHCPVTLDEELDNDQIYWMVKYKSKN